MHKRAQLAFIPTVHPDPDVARAGFDLAHPYLEQCWTPVLGPTATLMLRRIPSLVWGDRRVAAVPVDELAATLGVNTSAVGQAVRRLEAEYFLNPVARNTFEVYTTAGPLTADLLDRLPYPVHRSHKQLITPALRPLVTPPPTQNPYDPTAGIRRQLDQLQNGPPLPPPGLTR